MTLAAFAPRPSNLPLSRQWTAAPAFAALTGLILLAAVPLLLAMALDPRVFQGESVWMKPLKFHLALSVYLGTLALYARYLPSSWPAARRWRVYVAVVVGCILLELLWIGGAAALGTASHFNVGSLFWSMAYAAMGVAAVTLTSASLVMGIGVWRNAGTGLHPALHLSLALGLVLTFGLTVPVAGFMSQNLSHHVGVPATGASLAVMGWSREVGDLRVAHFLATHAMHALPLVGLLTRSQGVVWAAAAGYGLLVAGSFAQAISGLPFLPWIG